MEKSNQYTKKKYRQEDPAVKMSKKLSYFLRHGAEKEGLAIDGEGFVLVQDLLSNPQFKGITFDELQEIVDSNDKKRYEIVKKDHDPRFYIRCVWGHTIKDVDDEKVLIPINDALSQQFNMVVHGTTYYQWNQVKHHGIQKMYKNNICFAHGASEGEVMANLKDACEIFIEIDLQLCLQQGIKFNMSKNGVILSTGQNGVLHNTYFKRVWDIKGLDIDFPGKKNKKKQNMYNDQNFLMNQDNQNLQQMQNVKELPQQDKFK